MAKRQKSDLVPPTLHYCGHNAKKIGPKNLCWKFARSKSSNLFKGWETRFETSCPAPLDLPLTPAAIFWKWTRGTQNAPSLPFVLLTASLGNDSKRCGSNRHVRSTPDFLWTEKGKSFLSEGFHGCKSFLLNSWSGPRLYRYLVQSFWQGGGINLNKSDFCDFVIIRWCNFTKKKSQAQIRVQTLFLGPKFIH